MIFTSVDDLAAHVALAVEVELSTIPLYLYGLYSIEDQGSDAAAMVRSVAAEEMLHVALCSNLLVGLGGAPDFTNPAILPRYPAPLKHHQPELILNLAPCTIEQIRDTYMVVERPEVHDAPPEPDVYETLGQFYHALERGIHELADDPRLFAKPHPERQMGDGSFYAPVAFDADDSGGLMTVLDVESACAAIEVIVHQGEGLSDHRWADPAHQELTHYHKFKALADGKVALPRVRPARVNPTREDMPDDLLPVVDLFNGLYRYLMLTMDGLFSDMPEKARLVGDLYGIMSGLMRPVARYLMSLPLGPDEVAGPTFEFYDLSADDPVAELIELAVGVQRLHRGLDMIEAIGRMRGV
jgi:hypothetical protein